MNDPEMENIPDELIEELVLEHSHSILMELLKMKPELIDEVNGIAVEFLKDINEDDIRDVLFLNLDNISVESVWDRSGPTRYGYVDPTDLAWEMFEEEVAPFVAQSRKYHETGMKEERDICFRGILKGLERFKVESYSEYMDLIPDAPEEAFEGVVEEWKDLCREPDRIDEYLQKEFQSWTENKG